MPPIFITKHVQTDGSALQLAIRAMAQFQGKTAVTATALTDNSGGAAAASPYTLATVAAAASTNASGSNLADKTTTEAAYVTVQNALATLFAKVNAAATTLGLPTVTYNGGGTSGGNTVAAVTQTVTAASTGCPFAAYNTMSAAVAAAFYELACVVNMVCTATGQTQLDASAFKGTVYSSTVAAISTNTGTATGTGSVLATKANADLAAFANDVATVAARINACVSGTNTPGVVAK